MSTNPASLRADASFSGSLKFPVVPDIKDETFKNRNKILAESLHQNKTRVHSVDNLSTSTI